MAKKGKGGAPAVASKISFNARKKKKLRGKPEQPDPSPRLKAYYESTIRPALKETLGITSLMELPRVTKVVVSMGVGDANDNPKRMESLLDDVETITGQRPQVTRSRVSVANFQLREGMPVGCRATLRKAIMWEFLDRLIALVIPRMRDFRGLNPKSFDGRGNYSFGLPDQLVFPEINADRVQFSHGMNITICTTAPNDEQARELLRLLGFPLRDIPVVITLSGKEEA
jgi:large subunit ribosomal protein L5